jgi:thermostable 8-oxoguanine DNA glycosylase
MSSININAQLTLFRDKVLEEVDETIIWKEMEHALKQFPSADEELLPGLKWGFCSQLYTPAFWKLQYLLNGFSGENGVHRLSNNLLEEIVLCLLGGYGIPSEMGIIAFDRLKAYGLLRPKVSLDELSEALSSPFQVSEHKSVKYRFANQKATYIHDFLNREDIDDIPDAEDLRLRDWLTTLKGVGPKTASWITRNWLRSERVAILDIHILRAGVITGFFKPNFNITTEYFDLEGKYLSFCNFLQVRPSDMDAIIWSYMKKNNKLALNILSSIT